MTIFREKFLILFLSFPFYLAHPQDTTRTTIPGIQSADSLKEAGPVFGVVTVEETHGLIAEEAGDFVALLPGITVVDYGGLGQSSSFSVRGAAPAATQVLLGDLALVEPINGALSSTIIPINIIALMQISRAGTAGGSVGTLRFDMLSFQSRRPYSKVIFRAGDWGYTDIGITLAMPVTGRSHFLFSSNRQELDGFRPALAGHKGAHVFSKLTYSFSADVVLNHTT
ncbi:MAG TPA: TonB-dependent receptor plug domain-containing protein, partial [bacterium]